MSRQRSAESLADEAARWRRSYREAREVIAEQNRMLLGVVLREKLADPSDFDTYIGAEAVTDVSGRIVWRRLVLLVDELLERKPHLAATPVEDPFRRGSSPVDWVLQQSDGGQGPAD